MDGIEAPFALTAGWHHLAGVRDTDLGRLELYVDGVMVSNKSTVSVIGPIDSVVSTIIGQVSPTYNGEFFAGLIDEPAIYSRALSAAEIQAVYNAGSDGKCDAPTLQIRALPGAVRLSWTRTVKKLEPANLHGFTGRSGDCSQAVGSVKSLR